MYGLRVVLADADDDYRKYLKEKLLNAGHSVVGESSNGRQVLQMAFTIQPDLVVMDPKLPDRNGIEVAKTIDEHRIAPVILVAEQERQDELSEVLEDWMISYILKPVDETNLIPAIEVCRTLFKRICRLEAENRKLRQTLETRKVLEKAKGLLVRCSGMTEQQAFKHIQKLSMDKCQPVKLVARQIILALEG